MTNRVLTAVLALALYSAVPCLAEVDEYVVHLKFEKDRSPVAGPRNIDIFMKAPRKRIRCQIRQGRFTISKAVVVSTVDIEVLLSGRRLLFRDISSKKFGGVWTIGIDTPPLDVENTFPFKGKLPREIWFIDFDPLFADGTRALVALP